MSDLSKGLRVKLEEQCQLGSLTIDLKQESTDGTIKYSIGRPCRDHADEVAGRPVGPVIPPSRASDVAADMNISRRNGESPVASAALISAAIYRSKAEIGGR